MQAKPLTLIYNEKSGSKLNNSQFDVAQIVDYFQAHGFDVQSFILDEINYFDQHMQTILHRHLEAEDRGVIVSAGGDGTLNAIARHLLHHPIPLGILPLGTFNYVARLWQIPLGALDAAKVIATGKTQSIHVACINQQIYLNNASLGLYPLFIQRREHYNRYFGRFPLHAYTSALDVLIRHADELKLAFSIDGQRYPVQTPLIFMGNNQLQLQDLNLKIAADVAQGLLAGLVVNKQQRLNIVKLLWLLVRGKIEQAKDVYSFSAKTLTIESQAKLLTVALDGEIFKMPPPLNFYVAQHALKIMVPHDFTSV
jgi:diacylglycerol kinase family enzyme